LPRRATSGALRKVRGYNPDVLVFDVNMPGGPSLVAIPSFLEASPGTAIVVLTMEDEPRFARQALRAGALAFVLNEATDAELEEAVHAALAGETYLNPRLGARVATEPEETTGAPDGLSDRELEVLRLVALGYTNAKIGNDLFLSIRTVESHRSHVQQKIGATSRADLVLYAQQHGLFG
jgi:two-component system, NarL family, response regulator NreC